LPCVQEATARVSSLFIVAAAPPFRTRPSVGGRSDHVAQPLPQPSVVDRLASDGPVELVISKKTIKEFPGAQPVAFAERAADALKQRYERTLGGIRHQRSEGRFPHELGPPAAGNCGDVEQRLPVIAEPIAKLRWQGRLGQAEQVRLPSERTAC
jgi:hypothetical protein